MVYSFAFPYFLFDDESSKRKINIKIALTSFEVTSFRSIFSPTFHIIHVEFIFSRSRCLHCHFTSVVQSSEFGRQVFIIEIALAMNSVVIPFVVLFSYLFNGQHSMLHCQSESVSIVQSTTSYLCISTFFNFRHIQLINWRKQVGQQKK